MKPTAAAHEVMKMRFFGVNGRFSRKELSTEEAAEITFTHTVNNAKSCIFFGS
jgi:hypothetical protein